MVSILHPPAYYRTRLDKIKQVSFTKFNKELTEDEYLLLIGTTNTNKICKVLFKDSKITIKTDILIDCNCESFKYEFSAINFKDLLNQELYLNIKPKDKNSFNLPAVCKHLYAFGQYIFNNKNRIML